MRKMMTLVAVGLLAAPLFLFAGGSNEQPGTSSSGLANVDPSNQTITYWNPYTQTLGKEMKALTDEFNSTNQWHITVKESYAGEYADIYNKMITAIAGNKTPDLVTAYQYMQGSFELSNALVDLNPYVDSPKWGIKNELSDYFTGYLQQDVHPEFGGKRLGFPLNRSFEVLYYNVDWLKRLGFDNPPKTWEEFFQMCKKATESGSGKHGYAITTGASNMFSQVISRGGTIVQPNAAGYNLDNKALAADMEFMQKLLKDGYGTKVAVQYGEQTLFATQKVLFAEGTTTGLPYYRAAIEKSGAPFNWSIAALPHSTPKPALNIYGASVSVPKSTPQKQLAAWLFIKWLSQPKQQAAWVEKSNYFPVRKSTASELGSYFKKNPQYQTAFDILKGATTDSEPAYSGYAQVRDDMSSAFNAILDGADVSTTLAKLQQKATKVFKQSAS